jgi:hypothetical protein
MFLLVGVAQNLLPTVPTVMVPDVIFISSLPDHMQLRIAQELRCLPVLVRQLLQPKSYPLFIRGR